MDIRELIRLCILEDLNGKLTAEEEQELERLREKLKKVKKEKLPPPEEREFL